MSLLESLIGVSKCGKPGLPLLPTPSPAHTTKHRLVGQATSKSPLGSEYSLYCDLRQTYTQVCWIKTQGYKGRHGLNNLITRPLPRRDCSTVNYTQAFSQMGIQASCGWPLIEENRFILHMLLYEFFI